MQKLYFHIANVHHHHRHTHMKARENVRYRTTSAMGVCTCKLISHYAPEKPNNCEWGTKRTNFVQIKLFYALLYPLAGWLADFCFDYLLYNGMEGRAFDAVVYRIAIVMTHKSNRSEWIWRICRCLLRVLVRVRIQACESVWFLFWLLSQSGQPAHASYNISLFVFDVISKGKNKWKILFTERRRNATNEKKKKNNKILESFAA